MTDDAQARADIERLWGRAPAARRGPRSARSAREIAAVAIGIADAGGLEAVTMRSVATALNMSPMGLYTYVPGRPELLELMIDETYGEPPRDYGGCRGWREGLERVAFDNWSLILRHPWLAEIEGHRPVLGPNVIAKYDAELGAIEAIGLDDVTLDLVLGTTLAFVNGAARAKLDADAVVRRTGVSDDAWWALRAPLLAEKLGTDFPRAQRVGAAAGARHDAPANPDAAFAFGLGLLLDGLERWVDQHRSAASPV